MRRAQGRRSGPSPSIDWTRPLTQAPPPTHGPPPAKKMPRKAWLILGPIGQAQFRERVCQYVSIPVVADTLKQNTKLITTTNHITDQYAKLTRQAQQYQR